MGDIGAGSDLTEEHVALVDAAVVGHNRYRRYGLAVGGQRQDVPLTPNHPTDPSCIIACRPSLVVVRRDGAGMVLLVWSVQNLGWRTGCPSTADPAIPSCRR